MPPATNHWHILGAGAIGSLWASYWTEDQVDLTLITRDDQPRRQWRLLSPLLQRNVELLCETAASNTPIDRLLLATKAYQTESALADVKHRLSPTATVLVLQNGAAVNQLQLAPTQTLFAAVTTDGAYFDEQRRLIHAGVGVTRVGRLSGKKSLNDASDCQALRGQLPRGLNIDCVDNIQHHLWQKLVINCAINPLAIKYLCRNGDLLTVPEARADLNTLCCEISAVDCAMHGNPWVDNVLETVTAVIETTAANRNSMLQDVLHNRATEIDQINGYLQRNADEHGVNCPLNRQLIALVKAQTTNKI